MLPPTSRFNIAVNGKKKRSGRIFDPQRDAGEDSKTCVDSLATIIILFKNKIWLPDLTLFSEKSCQDQVRFQNFIPNNSNCHTLSRRVHIISSFQ